MSAQHHSPAALALRRTMEQISEEHWAAGWYHGLERILWRWMQWDVGVLSEEERAVLRFLCAEAGGWWHWPKEEPEPVFVALEQWQGRHEEEVP